MIIARRPMIKTATDIGCFPSPTSYRNCALAIAFTIAQPIWFRRLTNAITLAGYQPKEYLGITMSLRPSFGPKVAMRAGGIEPMMLKNKMQRNESHHPRSNSEGSRLPVTIVATSILTPMKIVKRSLGD